MEYKNKVTNYNRIMLNIIISAKKLGNEIIVDLSRIIESLVMQSTILCYVM